MKITLPFANDEERLQEVERLTKELNKLEAEIKRADGKLSNKGFVENAPVDVVQKERERLLLFNTQFSSVQNQISALQAN